MRVLLTGIGGFIGAHTVRYILQHTDWDIVGIDSWRPEHKNSGHRLIEATRDLPPVVKRRLTVHRWDLTHHFTPSIYSRLFEKPVDFVISMASDSRVTHSVHNPGDTWFNNCQIAYNMLEAARNYPIRMFIQVSTDEVYGDVPWDSAGHSEWDTVLPSNVYSASKAAQEALSIAYWRTYGVPVVITNTMNVIGEWQDPEKFLPLAIKRIQNNEPMTLFGESDGRTSQRVWLDVKNMAAALVFLCKSVSPVQHKSSGDRPLRYHIVGDTELSVRDLALKVADKLGKKLIERIVPGNQIRPGYDSRYALVDNYLRPSGFHPPFTFDQTLDRIIQWAKENPNWVFE